MNSPWPEGFEALARQYWTAWNQMLASGQRPAWPGAGFAGNGGFGMPGGAGFGVGGMGMPGMGGIPGLGAMPGMAGLSGFGAMPGFPGMSAGMPGGWGEAMRAWSQMAMDGSDGSLRNVLDRLGAQAGGWWTQIQELAARMAEQNASATDIAAEWRQMLESQGGNAILDMFRGLQGVDSHGFDAWHEAAKPYLDAWRREAQTWLGMPAFGLMREHQERIQQLLQAQVDYQDRMADYNALLGRVAEDAIGIFQQLLSQRDTPEKQVKTARALFDVWVDAAEQAYAKVALSPEFRKAYGEMVNAQMRLRQHVQGAVEQVCSLFGLPTRTELDAAHRKIAELERAMRRQRDREDDAADMDSPISARSWADMMEAARASTSKPAARKKPRKPGKLKPATAAASTKTGASKPATPAPAKTAKKAAPARNGGRGNAKGGAR